MPVRRTPATKQPARRGRPAAKTPPASTSTSRKRDVTQYASKPPSNYHKAFARWILQEVGFDPDAASPRKAFLMGVAIATAARPAFMESDFLEEWRAKSGETKRGPKPKEEEAPARSTRKRAAAPVVEDDDDEDEFDDEDASDEDDEDDFDDEDDSSDDDEDDDDDDFDDDDEEDEPAPVKRGPGRPRKAAPAPAPRGRAKAPAKKAAPATRGKAKPAADDDDDFVF